MDRKLLEQKYGKGHVVELQRKDQTVNALVLKSEVLNVQKFKPTPVDPGIRQEEHLCVVWINPDQETFSGTGMDRSIVKEFGVVIQVEENPTHDELPAPSFAEGAPAHEGGAQGANPDENHDEHHVNG